MKGFICAACLALTLLFAHEGAASTSMLDSYALQINALVRENYKGHPSWATRYYTTTARIEIDQKGRLLGVSITKKSGNKDFDSAVLRAIRRTAYFGEPPVPGLRIFGLRFDSETLNKS